MSLVGSLEDLGLEDMLQIVGLSRKSGVLLLRSELGQGRIVMREGMVRGAAIEGRRGDLESLLLDGGHLDPDQLRGAREQSQHLGVPLMAALAEFSPLEAEQIESICREHVERLVLEMFRWRCGEFIFEAGSAGDPEKEPLLCGGVNAQYFAMEATRLDDESGEPEPEPQAAPWEAGADLEIAPEEPAAAAQDSPTRVEASLRLVAIDPELDALEWLKGTLAGLFTRVHIFQRWENGVARIRQVLGHGEVPVVLLSAGLGPLASDGRRDVAELVARLRGLAPRMTVLVMEAEGVGLRAAPEGASGADALLLRPPAARLTGRSWAGLEAAGRRLRQEIEPWASAQRRVPPPARPVSAPRPDLKRLREVSDRLRDPSSRGDVLSVVLRFAAECLPRAAIFTASDGTARGLAQVGLPSAGGPDDEALRGVRLSIPATPVLRRVLETRRPVCAAPAEGDRGLVEALGSRAPREIYAAPIESGGRVMALVIADALPEDRPVGDMSALEVVLHEAGLVLDAALLERALARAPGR